MKKPEIKQELYILNWCNFQAFLHQKYGKEIADLFENETCNQVPSNDCYVRMHISKQEILNIIKEEYDLDIRKILWYVSW